MEEKAKTKSGNNQESGEAKVVSGGEAVILSLLQEGVDQIFGYPGGANMPIYDALFDYTNKIDHLLARHEQGAAHAAEGYAKSTGKTPAVFATSGPGAINLATGIANANIDSAPMVCITGQVKKDVLGSDAFQETDIMNITSPITKWNYQITDANEIPLVIAKAFYIASSGRPGPVLIDITKNAQFEKITFTYNHPGKNFRTYQPVPEPKIGQIEAAAKLINNASKPLALVGQGVLIGNAENELDAFLKKTGIPAAVTGLGLSSISPAHPNYVGLLGMHGNYAPNVLTNEADLILAIGMRFDDRVTGNLSQYAVNAKVIHMDIDPAEINKNVKADVPVLGDVKETLPLLTQNVNESSFSEWRAKFDEYSKVEKKALEKNLYPDSSEMMSMAEVIRNLSEQDPGSILVTDVGQNQMAGWRYFNFKSPRTNITSGGLGTMGYGLPAAIGAKTGNPDKEVLLICGDGGFQMTIQELGTIAQSNIPIKMVIFNNSYLGMVRQWQQLFNDKRYSSTPMSGPDFIKIAESYGIKALQVDDRNKLPGAIKQMYESDEAFLLEVVVHKEDNVFPMIAPGTSVSDIMVEAPQKKDENK